MPPRRPWKRQRRESWESAFDNKETQAEARVEWKEEQKKKEKDPGEHTDRHGIPSAPPSTLSLAFTSIPSSIPSIINSIRGPVPSLMTLAAKQVSLNLEEYHPDWFQEGRLPEDATKELMRSLARSDQGWKVDLGNWVRLGVEFGSMAMDRLPEVKEEMLSARASFFNPNPPPLATELINTPYHRHLPLELLELTSSLQSQPATSPLLHLVQPLLRKSPMNILTSLSLAGSNFVDEQASCLRGLKFLVSLDLSRTRATDAAVKTLASALYVPPDSGGERRGLWQLKAWSLRACGGISDRSATSLKEFPFLSYVDVRETSATLPTFPLLLSNPGSKSSTASTSTWTPLEPPPASIHDYLHPPSPNNRTPLTLFIHQPSRSGLVPPPRLPSRSSSAQTTFVSAPFTRSLPSNSLERSESQQTRKGPICRVPVAEEAMLKARRKGAADLLASILASVSTLQAPVARPPRKSNLSSSLPFSSPDKYSTNPFGSSSPAKHSAAPTPKPKPRIVRARSSSSDIEIIGRPTPPPPSKPRPGPINPFAANPRQPSSSTGRGIGGGATSFNLGRGGGSGGTKASSSSLTKSMGGVSRLSGGKGAGGRGGADGFKPRPKERKAIGEGARALSSSSSSTFFFKKSSS